jgi:DNA-binding MarR family transcriptional regulator
MANALPASLRKFQKAIGLVVAGEGPDLSARQLAVLLRVAEKPNPALGVKELAEQLGVSKPAITRAMDRLIDEHEFLKRTPHPMDRRKIEASLAPKGEAYIAFLAAGLA